MKKFLLVTCAFAACMGASAQQHLQKAPVANHALKLSELNAVQFNGVAKKAPAKKVDTKSFIGIFVNNAWDEEKEINFSTTDTLYTANVQDQQGNTLNVKWNIYGNSLGHVYGKFDEATNTFTVPMQQYFGDGAPIDLGDEQSPIVFMGVSTNDYFCDFVCKYDPATGLLTPNDTISGYYAIVAEGSYQNAWVMRNVGPTIGHANAIHTGSYTKDNAWVEFEQPVWIDYSAAEDGVVDIYNHFLTGTGAGCKLSVDVDGQDATMCTGQPMLYISDESQHAQFGKYIILRGVAVNEEEGTISPDFDMPTIEGGSYVNREVSFPNVYYRGFSNVVNGQGYATPFYVNSYFTPLATGIAGVTVKAEKAADNRIFNLAGQQVSKDYKGVVIQNGVKKLQK